MIAIDGDADRVDAGSRTGTRANGRRRREGEEVGNRGVSFILHVSNYPSLFFRFGVCLPPLNDGLFPFSHTT